MLKQKFLLMLSFVGLAMGSTAQTQVYRYNNFTTDQRSLVTLPNGDHAVAETTTDLNLKNNVHLTIYDQAGNISLDKLVDTEDDYSLQSVDIEHFVYNGNDLLFLTMLRTTINDPNYNAIELLVLDLAGNPMTTTTITSNDPAFVNLFPMDALFDPNLDMLVICGSATEVRDSDTDPFSASLQKAAFVVQVDMNMAVTNMNFYNSFAGTFTKDYDIATRVKLTSTGTYYLMGSENVDKGLSEHITGIRNMLIDQNNLSTIWSTPMHLNRNNSWENSVDMIEMQTNNASEFIVLVNSSETRFDMPPIYFWTAKWWLQRINPSNGLSLYNNFETTGPISHFQIQNGSAYLNYCNDIGFRLQKGNKPGDIVVSGLKFPTLDQQCNTMTWGTYQLPTRKPDVVPFMATINVLNYPTTVVSHLEYSSVLTGTYWGLFSDNLYSNFPFGDYYVLNYLSEFSDRLQPNNSYGMAAPVDLQTTKYLDINGSTANGCDDVRCNYFIAENSMLPVYPALDFLEYSMQPSTQEFGPMMYDIYPDQIDNCASGHYKTTTLANTGSEPEKDIRFYPNPATDKLNIEFSSALVGNDFRIRLEDITGKEVVNFSGIVTKATIQIAMPSNITNGLYYIVLQSGKIVRKEKIVLSR